MVLSELVLQNADLLAGERYSRSSIEALLTRDLHLAQLTAIVEQLVRIEQLRLDRCDAVI